MNFVKLGTRFINLDSVYQVTFTDNHTNEELVAILDIATPISMYREGPEEITGPIESETLHVTGQNAEALRYYLDGHSDQAEKAYSTFLENQERKRLAEEKEQQFQAFCTDKDLSYEEKYSFRYWLQNEELEWPTNEETYQNWRKWQSDKFEEQINSTVKAANIPAKRIEEFKEYCKTNGITQPQYYEGLQFLQQKEKTVPMF